MHSQEAVIVHSVNQRCGCSLVLNTERMLTCVPCAGMSSSIREI